MKYKHIIWDWNGTLLDDNRLAITAINILLKKYKLRPIELDAYLEVFSFPVIDYYRKLGFNFDKTPFEIVGTEFIDEYTKRMYQPPLHKGAIETLNYINGINLGQSLLSAAEQKMLDVLMEYHDLNKFFYKVCGLDDHYANSKVNAGMALVNELDCDSDQIIVVGDTLHDIDLADEIGANCILISQGHNSHRRLLASRETGIS